MDCKPSRGNPGHLRFIVSEFQVVDCKDSIEFQVNTHCGLYPRRCSAENRLGIVLNAIEFREYDTSLLLNNSWGSHSLLLAARIIVDKDAFHVQHWL